MSPVGAARPIEIVYRRPPDRVRTFRQTLVHESGAGVVTLLEPSDIEDAVEVDGASILEPGAAIVWFTFPGAWHDVGRFHLRDDTFTGLYANVLTPVQMEGSRWNTTDLFLDLWLPATPAAEPVILDEDELAEAELQGWIEPHLASRARKEVVVIRKQHHEGAWPPAIVGQWPLARARMAAARRA